MSSSGFGDAMTQHVAVSKGVYAPLADADSWADGSVAAPLLVQADHLKRSGAIRSLSAPVRLYAVDFNRLDELPERCEASVETVAVAAGQCDAILVWWRAHCATGDAGMGTVPGSPFQDHWHSSLFSIGEPMAVAAGSSAVIDVVANDVRMEVTIERPAAATSSSSSASTLAASASGPPPVKRPRAPRPPRFDARLASAAAAHGDASPTAAAVERACTATAQASNCVT